MSRKVFDPRPLFKDFRTAAERGAPRSGDQRDGKVYYYEPDLVLAINVALATGRPLLLRGHAGSGKSSMAFNVARELKRCYYEQVVSSRMEARDLLWRFDAVRRLGDAQVRGAQGGAQGPTETGVDWRSYHPYIEPGVLWWLFDAKSAARRGLPDGVRRTFPEAKPPLRYRPDYNPPLGKAVLLLDEIDKAEPDVPNNLLVALGSMEFRIDEIGVRVAHEAAQKGEIKPEHLPLIVITTNEERQLPPAFLRRCVVYRFAAADDKRLISIARKSEGPDRSRFYQLVATSMRKLAVEEGGKGAHVSIAEYLDAVRACKRLGKTKRQADIAAIVERVIRKRPSRD